MRSRASRRNSAFATRSSSCNTPPGSRSRAGCARSSGWRVVYDCMDEHTGFGTHGAGTAEDERRLLTGSDLVLVTSRPLLDQRRAGSGRTPWRSRTRRMRSGSRSCPPAARARSRSTRVRSSATTAPSQRGSTRKRSPWRARKHPDWSFALVGDTKGAALESLEGRPERAPARRSALCGSDRLRRGLRRLHDSLPAHAADRSDQPRQALRVPRDGKAHRRPPPAGARAVRRGHRPLRHGRRIRRRPRARGARTDGEAVVANRREDRAPRTPGRSATRLYGTDSIVSRSRAPSTSLSPRERVG